MAEKKMKIEGMSCQHCVMAVKKALGGVPGMLESTVEVGSALVKYDESKTNAKAIEEAVEKAGYKVHRMKISRGAFQSEREIPEKGKG